MNAADLQAFCADASDIRWYICKPWSRGEYTYATNGHILIRVPRLDDVAAKTEAPDAQKLMDKTAPATVWMPVPSATMPPDVECGECDGTGVYTETYQGKAFSEDCEFCNHTGKVKARIGMNVGPANFDQGYLSMIQGWEIAPNGKKGAAWIRHGDVIGLLMPRNV